MRYPEEETGPYPVGGSNGADGDRSNALAENGIVRSDIRRSFGDATGIAHGVPLNLSISLIDTTHDGAPLAGHAVYVWQCRADGLYSCYPDGIRGENFLRGVQVADARGKVSFRSIFPGCYWGRYPHIHFEIYPDLEAAKSYRNKILTSQMALPREIAGEVYAKAEGYGASSENLHSITTSSDEVFGDNTAEELATMTPKISGNTRSGYDARIVIGVVT
jgi:protocatechuate 3,4-dioxygenase beta subunit